MQSQWVRSYLQPFTQYGSCEVVCHELMVDEAHDTVSKEDSRKLLPQQHFLHKRLKSAHMHPVTPLYTSIVSQPFSIVCCAKVKSHPEIF